MTAMDDLLRGFKQAEKIARNVGKPRTGEGAMHVEIIVTFPDGQQSKFSTPIGTDGDQFAWGASKGGAGISINGETHERSDIA